MNVLFVGAGKRVTMANLFKQRGHKVFSYETSKNVPISTTATVIEGLKWNDPNISQDINKTCDNNNIEIAIPFQDEAVGICAHITKAKSMCRNETTAQICYNKQLFENYMLQTHPHLYPKVEDKAPKIYKPIHGFGSRGLIRSQEYQNLDPKQYILQKCINGQEYSVDCYSNSSGKFIDGVPRKRLEVCCGEVTQSITTDNPKLVEICETISNSLKLQGPSCFQFIIDEHQKPFVIEINYRFGGGCTLSINAGFDMISLITQEVYGSNVESPYTPKSWIKNLKMIRYFQDYTYESHH